MEEWRKRRRKRRVFKEQTRERVVSESLSAGSTLHSVSGPLSIASGAARLVDGKNSCSAGPNLCSVSGLLSIASGAAKLVDGRNSLSAGPELHSVSGK